MTIESVFVSLFYLIPGFISLKVYEWLVATRSHSPLEVTSWSIAISVMSAAPFVALPRTRAFMTYLWQPTGLSADVLLGVSLQTAGAIALGVGGAFLVLRVLGGRIARWSFYQRGWDWLWGSFGSELRFLQVTTETEKYFGMLAFADEPSAGRDIVLRDPAIWVDGDEQFFRSGMKYMLIPGSTIRTVELSTADPPTREDRPYYGAGFVSAPTEEESIVGQATPSTSAR